MSFLSRIANLLFHGHFERANKRIYDISKEIDETSKHIEQAKQYIDVLSEMVRDMEREDYQKMNSRKK